MNTCKDCKHWKRNPLTLAGTLDMGYCQKVRQFWDVTEWWETHDEVVRKLKSNVDTKAFVQDGSDYRAELITMQDFGCNQFKKLS